VAQFPSRDRATGFRAVWTRTRRSGNGRNLRPPLRSCRTESTRTPTSENLNPPRPLPPPRSPVLTFFVFSASPRLSGESCALNSQSHLHLVRMRLLAQSSRHRRIDCRARHRHPPSPIRALQPMAIRHSRLHRLLPGRLGRRRHRNSGRHQRSPVRGHRRGHRHMDRSGRRTNVQLEELSGGPRALPPVRHLEAASRAPTREPCPADGASIWTT
jgi:hypothetical protein